MRKDFFLVFRTTFLKRECLVYNTPLSQSATRRPVHTTRFSPSWDVIDCAPVIFNWNAGRSDYSTSYLHIPAIFSVFFSITWTAACSCSLFFFQLLAWAASTQITNPFTPFFHFLSFPVDSLLCCIWLADFAVMPMSALIGCSFSTLLRPDWISSRFDIQFWICDSVRDVGKVVTRIFEVHFFTMLKMQHIKPIFPVIQNRENTE